MSTTDLNKVEIDKKNASPSARIQLIDKDSLEQSTIGYLLS